MIKVLANDGLQKEAIDKLTSMGFEVVNFHYDKDELGNILRKFDALIIRSATKVTSDVIDIEAGGKLKLIIRAGVGIDNIHREMEPLFTTKPELERSGMGFSFMEAFMDELEVHSRKQKGTTVIMKKKIGDSNI